MRKRVAGSQTRTRPLEEKDFCSSRRCHGFLGERTDVEVWWRWQLLFLASPGADDDTPPEVLSVAPKSSLCPHFFGLKHGQPFKEHLALALRVVAATVLH